MSSLVAPSERLPALDAARGFALLGVAVVNIHTFNIGFNSGNYAMNLALTGYDRAAEILANLLFSHRAFPVLAFLLGVGLVVQTRVVERGYLARSLRGRYLALLAIGVAHGLLLWPGEILSAYALLVLLLARCALAWQPRTFDRVLGMLLVLSFGFALAGMMRETGAFQCKREDFFLVTSFAQTTWIAARIEGAKEFALSGLVQVLGAWFPALVLLGIYCARSARFWAHLQSPRWTQPVVVASLAMLTLSTAVEWKTGSAGAWSSLICEGGIARTFSLAENATIFAIVPVMITLFAFAARAARDHNWFLRLVAVGRAPLTMFIGQSVVFSTLFSHHLFGLHARIGRAGSLLIALLTYLMLAAWIDQRYIQRGKTPPVERLWRALSARFAHRHVLYVR
jgi:uncharacterized protein